MSNPKPNEGAVIEGIFALCAGLYIKNGKISNDSWSSQFSTKEVQELRKLINPQEWAKGSSVVQLINERNPIKLASKRKPTDYIKKIEVSIRLKYGEAAGGYGGKISFNPISIQDKIDTLSKLFSQLVVGKQLKNIIDKLLSNSESDYMNWYVTADGVGGEQSGGKIKGDVVIKLTVDYFKNGKKIQSKTQPILFSYSLKSNSKTWANLSPWRSTLELINNFELDKLQTLTHETFKSFAIASKEDKKTINSLIWPPTKDDTEDAEDKSDGENFKLKIPSTWTRPSSTVPNCYVMLTGAKTNETKRLKQQETLKTVKAFHILIDKKFKSIKNNSTKLAEFSSKWWNLLYESGSGEDFADVIDVRSGGIQQIQSSTLRNFVTQSKAGKEYLLSNVKLERGNVIIFYIESPFDKKQIPVFSLRMRAEYRASKQKLFTKFLFEHESGLKKLKVFENFRK